MLIRTPEIVDMETVLYESTASVACNVKSDCSPQNQTDNYSEKNENSHNSRLNVLQQKMPVDIKFENVTFTASYRAKSGNLPVFLRKKGR